MMEDRTPERYHIDVEKYSRSSQTGPCFICEIVAGTHKQEHHIVYEDDSFIAFLNRFPPLFGYVLVAPKPHLEQATGDFTLDEYVSIQQVIYHVAEAARQVTAAERVYILSLGSQQGNRHVHWHIAPLPPGVPYEEQQMAALDFERAGILKLSREKMVELASEIGQEVRKSMGQAREEMPAEEAL